MKLHELSPAEGSKKAVKRIGRGAVQAKVRQPVRVTKVKRHVQVTAEDQDLKAVRCHFKDVCQKEVLITSLQQNTLL